jgi:Ni,Fe-hydrogenase III small subunit/ferredoxin
MFKILQKTLRAGTATMRYPEGGDPPEPAHRRGSVEFDFANWRDAQPAADECPAGAITIESDGSIRTVKVDYGRCIFCGECAAATTEGAVRVTPKFERAAATREDLVMAAEYFVSEDGVHQRMIRATPPRNPGRALKAEIHRILGRSLAIREVDAGSCNACELEINALNNPVYDLERLGIHFVASPRHADMLLVTGPVTRNMELALRKTYAATPEPKLVVAAGTCGISGGLFGENYATRGGVDRVLPVDVYIPGCPPSPDALLYGILLAVGRIGARAAR